VKVENASHRPVRGRDRRTIESRADIGAAESARPRAIFVGFNALGDTLCTTPTIRAYRRRNPSAHITYIVQSTAFTRVLDGNPDIDVLLYSEFLSRHGMSRFSLEWVYQQPLDFTRAATLYHFDMNQVCTTKEAFEEHIAKGLSNLLQIPIDSVRPVVHVSAEERAVAATVAKRPYAVLSIHSNANPRRANGGGRVKDWPLERYEALSLHLRRQGIEDVIAVGSEFDERHSSPLWRNFYGLPIKVVAALLQDAALVVTLENGIGHLAHGVDAPMVMIYSNIVPLGWANPVEANRCKVLYDDPTRITVDAVIAAAETVMRRSRRRGTADPAVRVSR
jgi:ADP-heptose:LPS heptosyltransferase